MALALAAQGCESGPNGPEPVAPVLESFLLENGEGIALDNPVAVTLVAEDDRGLVEARLSENETFDGASWVPYAAGLTYELSSGNGPKTVFAQIRDEKGLESDRRSAEILLADAKATVCLIPAPGGSGRDADRVTFDLEVLRAEDLVSAIFRLSFDPDDLQVEDLEVEGIDDHILKATGANLIVARETYDNEEGDVLVGALAQQNGFHGVTGSGPFARITFRIQAGAGSPLRVEFVHGEDSKLYEYRAGDLPGVIQDAYLIDGEIER